MCLYKCICIITCSQYFIFYVNILIYFRMYSQMYMHIYYFLFLLLLTFLCVCNFSFNSWLHSFLFQYLGVSPDPIICFNSEPCSHLTDSDHDSRLLKAHTVLAQLSKSYYLEWTLPLWPCLSPNPVIILCSVHIEFLTWVLLMLLSVFLFNWNIFPFFATDKDFSLIFILKQ